MKSLSKYLMAGAVLAFSFTPTLLHAQYDGSQPPPPDQGPGPDDDQGASFQQFYDQLGSQGNWVQTDNYGYVFQPNVQDPNWAPYSDGHWVYTDSGWMWVSDEPWGWATYHYGRWANIDGMGWAWVPGYQWAPAWVSWRYGGGYCGWAPLPPETFIGAEYAQPGFAVGVGFHFGGDVDVSFNIGPGCYNFVPVGYLGERNYRGRYIDRSRNYTIINNTTNITNINVNRNGNAGAFRSVNVGGPRLAEINAHSTQHVQSVRLAEANQPGRAALNGNTLSVYAPRVNAGSIRTARPARVSQTIANPTFNRGDSISRPLQVTSNIQGRAASQQEIQAAQTAQAQAPARAKVANERTESRTQFTQPLTQLQPATTRVERAAANRELNQSHAQAEKNDRVNQAETNKTALDNHAQAEKDYRVQKAETNKAALDNHAQAEKDDRVNRAETDKTANQERAQQEKADRTQLGDERAARLQQEEANHQQAASNHQQAVQDAAQAREERAAALQNRQEHAEAVQQQHAAAVQQHAPAATHQAAPAAAKGNEDKKKNGDQGGPQGR